jgi:hypothetical protein
MVRHLVEWFGGDSFVRFFYKTVLQEMQSLRVVKNTSRFG